MNAVLGVLTAISAAGTVVLGVVAYRLTRQSARAEARRAIADLANRLARMRFDHPVLFRTARRWRPADWDLVYEGADPTTADGAGRYYAYVDIGLEFCNAVLAGGRTGAISQSEYADHYRPLVRLFVTENWPIVEAILAGPYVSPVIRDEIAAARGEGWDWAARHAALVGPPP